MKGLLLVISILLITTFCSTTISVNESCTCTQLKSQIDCTSLGCTWDSTNSLCLVTQEDNDESTISVYCNALETSKCASHIGCQLNETTCKQFSGCSAFIGTSNDACQQYSNQCTSDGTYCIDPLNCSDYTLETLCNSNINSSGRYCKWSDNSCRDLKCSEGSTAYTTDSQCDTVKAGCITNGRGCVESLSLCSTFSSDCAGTVGSDGYCYLDGTTCKPIQCSSASSDYTTDEKCAQYQLGCITNGLGCSNNPLSNCATYTGNASTCQSMIGSEGKCDGSDGTNCQARQCSLAAITNTTDADCQSYLSTCITNGRGCVISLAYCNTYTGNSSTCNSYIGIDGKCTLGSSTSCKARVCSEAQDTLKTDDDCNDYQTGCVTTGQGCTSSRGLCQSYTGTSTTCLNYIGSDGNCTSSSTVSAACSPQVCTTAPTTYNTNKLCQTYQSNCLTNGSGCVAQTTCIKTIAQTTCTSTSNCQWSNVCVTNTNCSYYTTLSLCVNNKGNNKVCFWTGSTCREKLCTDAGISITTDDGCNTFLSGCLTNGGGCLSSTAPCASYIGTSTTCANFKGNGIKCTNSSGSSSNCSDLTCSQNTTSLSQTECDSFLSGCKFQGNIGCVDSSSSCSNYSGTQGQCQAIVANNTKCYSDSNSVTQCRNLVCSDDTSSTSDNLCETFLSGCLTKGSGCIESTAPCTSYSGTSTSICSQFTGNGKKCWWTSGSFCLDKICTQDTSSTTDESCSSFLTGCLTQGSGCLSENDACTLYSGNESSCSKFIGNGQQCARKNNCQDRACSDVANPTSQYSCTSYLSSCRYNGSICINSQTNCTSYLSLNYQICQQITTNTDGKCYLSSGQGTCQTRQCTDKGTATNQSDCDDFLAGCLFSGSTCVAKKSTCEQYNNFLPAACEAASVTGSTLQTCWRSSLTGPQSCLTRTCTNLTATNMAYTFSQSFCQAYNSCQFNGTSCIDTQASCNLYTGFSSWDQCKSITTTTLEECWYNNNSTNCESRQCSDTISQPNSQNCALHKSSCRYNGTICVDSQTSCSSYTSFTQNACQETSLTDALTQCWKNDSSTGICAARACTDVLLTYSATNCINHLSTCRYNGTQCVQSQTTCTSYTSFTNDACQVVSTTSGELCWIPSTTTGQCTSRSCSDTITNPSEITCPQYKSTCRFDGTQCVDQQSSCQSYSGFTQIACQNTTTTGGDKCWKSQVGIGNCEPRNCSNTISNPSYTNCSAHLSTCTFDGTSCYTAQANCSLYTNLTAQQCQNVKTTSGGYCYLSSGSGTCQVRICSQNLTAMTDIECNSFLSGCKTKGLGCIDSTSSCSSYSGTTLSCLSFVGNGINCKGADSTGYCTNKQCQDNTTSTTDSQCSQFMTGCVTRGIGCIANTESCTKYFGTQTTCSLFIGNSKNCWNDSTATSTTQCRDKLCSDDTTSTTDSDCAITQVGCVTKGLGCIDQTVKCSSYTGTQSECKNFKGETQTKLCWNVSTATSLTSCVDRLCSHNLTATTDADCNTFLSGCVTKGQGCVASQPCSSFIGTTKTCPQFQASNKPCKGVSSTIIQSCVAVACTDAPNSYDTDELCNTFKEGCVTTGYGCDTSVTCENIQTKTACSKKSTCIFSASCTALSTDCSNFLSQSLCVNTPVNTSMTRCAWALNSNNVATCRDWKCTDASVSLTTHSSCQTLNTTCTTSGSGCITIGVCSSYTTSTICSAAYSSDEGNSCIWESNACRKLKCSDASVSLTTDTKCKQYLSSCITSGQGCIEQTYDCTELLIKSNCTLDSDGNTCLWYQKQCISFTKCSDISETTYEKCQLYSNQCTSNGTNCISISECSSYTTPTSCYTGLDGNCGWVIATLNTAAYCKLFNDCSDISQTTYDACYQYSNKCTSDGTKCILISICTSYLTQTACSTQGTDGVCLWDTTTTSCRLRQCTDATVQTAIEITSYAKCNAFQAETKCTTNGTNCISMNLCTSYTQSGCYYGTDGQCIYSYPSGSVQGVKSCRLMVCTDYIQVTTELCQTSNSTCISNGTNCITKSVCSDYTTKVSCNSGGTDGICVFTPSTSDTSVGTCALMTSCDQANSDSIACKSKYNSCYFLSQLVNGVQTTSCIDQTCATVASGSVCKPLYSFDETSVSVCITSASGCIIGEPSALGQSNCFSSSLYSYTWNSATSVCEKCGSTTNNTNNSNSSNNNTDTSSEILQVPIHLGYFITVLSSFFI